jgi:hypothetical protein
MLGTLSKAHLSSRILNLPKPRLEKKIFSPTHIYCILATSQTNSMLVVLYAIQQLDYLWLNGKVTTKNN